MKRTPESRPGRWRGARRAIVSRDEQQVGYLTGGGMLYGPRRIIRSLSCGHTMVEPDGGKAKDAQFALCRLCKEQP